MNVLKSVISFWVVGVFIYTSSISSFAKTASQIIVSEGIVVSNQSQEEVEGVLTEIYKRTGAIPESLVAGEIFIRSESELNNINLTRATTRPTTVWSYGEYSSDWSGTINYTYTKYLTPDYMRAFNQLCKWE